MKKHLLALVGCLLLLTGCTHKVKVDPIKVEPIYVTMDIRIKIDRDLQDFFSFEDKLGATQPSGQGEQPSGR
jgi:hypothetical protein